MMATLASRLHHGIGIGGGLILLVLALPHGLVPVATAGLAGWMIASFAEYALHRFVLHGPGRFSHEHARHHARPAEVRFDAMSYFAPFAFQGAAWLLGFAVTREAGLAHALLAGALLQYSYFRLIHDLLHRGRPSGVLAALAAFHRAHHLRPGMNYGVTVRFWDDLFGTAKISTAAAVQPVRTPFAPPPDLPLAIDDPCPSDDMPRGPLERRCLPWLKDSRDLAFVRLGLRASGTLIPLAVLIFCVPPWLAALLAAPYLWLLYGHFGGPVMLMMHALFHHKTFVGPGLWLDRYLRHGLPMLYGLQPFAYFPHHLLMHHTENNGRDDLSCTATYRRDDWRDFLRYWWRFMLGDNLRLARYLRLRGRKRALRRYVGGSLAWLLLVAGLLWVAPLATLIVFVLPYILTRFFMMAGNWAQHAFVDPEAKDAGLGNAIVLVNARQNRRCFNDGYHALHHRSAGLHWAEMSARFQSDWRYYAEHRVLVFDRIADTQVIWWRLMRRDYAYLADNLADMGWVPQDPALRVELLRRRTQANPPRFATG